MHCCPSRSLRKADLYIHVGLPRGSRSLISGGVGVAEVAAQNRGPAGGGDVGGHGPRHGDVQAEGSRWGPPGVEGHLGQLLQQAGQQAQQAGGW
jgi:hypothetical protein